MRRATALVAAALSLLPALAAARGRIPGALVASWYAGSGFTTAPVNPTTGAVGPADGKGLMYTFHADGTYLKAFQSTVSNGGCTTQLSATESGRVVASASELVLTPKKGTISFRSSCAPSLSSDKPNDDLQKEVLGYRFASDENGAVTLWLAAPSGAASAFRRVPS
jgi:hypothetical protein